MAINTFKETIGLEPQSLRHDVYEHYSFNERSDPELVQTALRVHAEGYTTMGFVSDDAVDNDGKLIDSIDHARGEFIDYFLAVNPVNASDMSTMRKINIPPGGSVENLPAFQLTKDGLYEEGVTLLEDLKQDGYQIKEIAGLARTKEASPKAVYELLRDAFQASLLQNEVWFFSIVSSTFDSLTKYFGKSTFKVIGEDIKINDYRVNERIQLRPSLLMVDKLFESMIYDIENSKGNKEKQRILGMFLYFSDGLPRDRMGVGPTSYRDNLLTFLAQMENSNE